MITLGIALMAFSHTQNKQKNLQTNLTQNFVTSDYNTNV